MVGSANLFRRHRNRDVDENGSPGPTSSGDVGEGGGGDEPPSASESNVNNTNASASESERRNNDVEAGNHDASIAVATSSPSGNDASNATSPADDDEEQELVVQIPSGHPYGSGSGAADPADGAPPSFVLPGIAWEPTEEATALRREAIQQEVRRVQRANFIHFLVLCLVPTTLLLIVIAAILGEDGECGADDGAGGAVLCEREHRSFVNAYTSRCICQAVKAAAVLPKLPGGGG